MDDRLIVFFLCILCSIPAFVYAYLIKIRKQSGLITRCDSKRVRVAEGRYMQC